MRAEIVCTFCGGLSLRSIDASGDRRLVACSGCGVRLWLPAILVEYRPARRKLLEHIDWYRYKGRIEGKGAADAVRAIVKRYRLQLADLRARLEEARRFPQTLGEIAA